MPLTISVSKLLLAIALPQPYVLNLASIIMPSSTLICNRITSPHAGAPTIPVPMLSAGSHLPTLRGLS